MSALLDVPEELLDAITTHLAQADVLSLARTCKALWLSASPRISRAISMPWDANKARASAPRITSLLRGLVKCPRNAERIEHVELQACNFQPYKGRRRPANRHAYRLRACDKPAFERNLTRMGLRDVDAWLSAIFDANDLRALMALLLMRCARLKSLNMALELFPTDRSDSTTWLCSMLDHCLSTPASHNRRRLSRFDRLTSVVITGPKHYAGWTSLPPDLIKCLFRIPSLVTLDIACCPRLSASVYEDVSPKVMADCIALDRLTVLKLPLAYALPHTLKALLRFTPNLKVLVYDVFMHARPGSFPNGDLDDALATLPETLEELTIRVHMYVRGAMDLSWLVHPLHGDGIGSLPRLRSLRSLTIAPSLLFGANPDEMAVPQLADVLPSSLESLHLVGDLTTFDSGRMYGARFEAILRSFLTGQERVDQPWSHKCFQVFSADCGRGCEPVWMSRSPPTWRSDFPHLRRIAVIEDESGYRGGEYVVMDWRRCKVLREMMSGQGLDLVYLEVDDSLGVPWAM